MKEAFDHLPIEEADVVVTGKRDPFYRNILVHTHAEDAFWTSRDHTVSLSQVNAAVHLMGVDMIFIFARFSIHIPP